MPKHDLLDLEEGQCRISCNYAEASRNYQQPSRSLQKQRGNQLAIWNHQQYKGGRIIQRGINWVFLLASALQSSYTMPQGRLQGSQQLQKQFCNPVNQIPVLSQKKTSRAKRQRNA